MKYLRCKTFTRTIKLIFLTKVFHENQIFWFRYLLCTYLLSSKTINIKWKNWEEKMMNWNQSSKLSSTKKRHFSSNSIDPYCSLIIGNLFRFDLSWTWTQVVVSSSIWSSSLWTWTVQQFFLRCVMMRLSMKSSSSNMSLWDEHK